MRGLLSSCEGAQGHTHGSKNGGGIGRSTQANLGSTVMLTVMKLAWREGGRQEGRTRERERDVWSGSDGMCLCVLCNMSVYVTDKRCQQICHRHSS